MTENLVQYRFSSYQFEFSLKIAVKYLVNSAYVHVFSHCDLHMFISWPSYIFVDIFLTKF